MPRSAILLTWFAPEAIEQGGAGDDRTAVCGLARCEKVLIDGTTLRHSPLFSAVRNIALGRAGHLGRGPAGALDQGPCGIPHPLLGGQGQLHESDQIDMPAFFKDRDFISRVVIRSGHAARELVFRFHPADDPDAPAAGHLRGEMINMTFALRSLDHDTRTRVDAEFPCDPKGGIPAWLVSIFLRDWPKTTLRNLRQEVQKPGSAVERRFAELLAPTNEQAS